MILKNKFRSAAPGRFMLIILVILLITFIGLKIKSPALPQNQDEQKESNKLICFGVISSVIFIVIMAWLAFATYNKKIELFFFVGTLFRVLDTILLPCYFIFSTSNLKEYALNRISKNLIVPLQQFVIVICNCLSKMKPTNQIDVVV